MTTLKNLVDRRKLRELIAQDKTPRTTISFYRYVNIQNPDELRDQLFMDWSKMGVLGRIYLAEEGVNAQFSVPTANLKKFRNYLDDGEFFKDVPFKIAVEDDGKSFFKLTIKVREKILADGLNDAEFDVTNVGTHLSAEQFNEAIESGAIVVDMRNHYESEVGHFQGAICPDSDTFREELPIVAQTLQGKENEKILFYCTGGIRCEKASAYFKHRGFKDVNQLKGGIIQYAHECNEKGLESKYKGKNFVFDERFGERITEDVISECHQCQNACDTHTNCKNDACHLLFIQCPCCSEKYDDCCSENCRRIAALPEKEQRKLRKNAALRADCLAVYKSRLRPKLSPSLSAQTLQSS